MTDKEYYNTILCQTFSPCGKQLYAGDIYGEISVFDIPKLVSPADDQSTEHRKPKFKFRATTDPEQVCSLITTDKFLICGTGAGGILGIPWQGLQTTPKPVTKPSWTIQLPKARDCLVKNEVNCMWFDAQTDLLYAGCGDNNVYVFTLEDGRIVRTLKAHDNYIHDIQNQGTQLVSASEDGSVCLWDIRDFQVTNKLFPFQNEKLNRPQFGKWIGAAALSDYWLLCGGGPRLALWHLQSMDVTTVFPTNDTGVHCVEFYEDRIMAGGSAPLLYQFSYNGDVYAEVPSSSATIYSIVHQEEPYKVLCIAGSSPCIDLCNNFSYRDQVLSLY